jgi:hypothetical protein
MPTRLPFPGQLDKNLLDTIVKQGSVELWNGFIDKTGAITKRPGLVLNQTPSVIRGITGLYWWESKRRYVLVGDGNVFSSLGSALNFAQVNSGLNTLQAGLNQFADSGEWLYICSTAGKVLGWNGSSVEPDIEPDPVAPVDVCSIAFFKGRLYAAVRDTNRIWYTQAVASTDPGLRLAWEGFIDVRRSGDPILAIQDMGAELIVFKRSSLESYYYDDSIESIRPVEGSLQGHGLDAPRAFKLIDEKLYFLTQNKQLAKIENRTVSILSQWVDSLFQAFRLTSDAYLVQSGKYLLVQFPTVDQTVVYDLDLGAWYRWSDFTFSKHKRLAISCSAYQPGMANHWMLGHENNSTYFLDPQSYWDDGTLIRFSVTSLHYDHGTSNRKLATRMVAKVAIDLPSLPLGAYRGIPVPDPPNPDPGIRCTAYTYTFPTYEGYVITATNLPAGLTYDTATQTISGTVPCQIGDFSIGVYATDERGARYRFTRTLTVADFTVTLTFEE